MRARYTQLHSPMSATTLHRRLSICRAQIPTRQLSRGSLLRVPNLCMGTMLFGESVSELEAFAQLDAAYEAGLRFFDSAEMYPIPQRADTQGRSEEILGKWLAIGTHRQDVVVATKVAGPSGQMTWLRGGPTSLDAANIGAAIDGSLRRLGVECIDLYQIHWPDRYVPMFGDVDYDPSCAYASVPLAEQLAALGRAVAAGKVRAVGLSNETAWGLTQCLHAADRDRSLPRVASLQNAYSLLCRTFDASLAEVCHEEGVGLLAYSPLAMGLLTGKYLEPGGGPSDARLNRYKGRYAEAESRYGPKPNTVAAVQGYCRVAAESGMSPTELAMRFVVHHPLVVSTVIGCTSIAQLHQLLAAAAQPPLPPDVLLQVEAVHSRYPNPAP